MGRSQVLHCDVCGKPTERIVAKIFYSPITRTQTKKSSQNNYTDHLDVGECCDDKLKRAFRWRKRLTAAEYQASRRSA